MPDFEYQGGKVDGRGVTPTRVDISSATEYRMGETFSSPAVHPSNFLSRGVDV